MDITPQTPLRLDDACRLAFPAGGMTVSGLRTEKRKGNLDVMMLAGKEFTTLEAIGRMLERCRANQKAPGSTTETRSGSSETAPVTVAQAAGKATLRALKQGLQNTSPKSTSQA